MRIRCLGYKKKEWLKWPIEEGEEKDNELINICAF